MKWLRILAIVCFAAVLSSCSIAKRSSFTPDRTELNLNMSDLEYLGEIEVTVDYNQYLGVFKKIGAINGIPYDGKKIDYAKHSAAIFGGGVIPDTILSRALPKVFETFPGADYIIIVGQQKEREVLFLGSENSVKARVKAYTLK